MYPLSVAKPFGPIREADAGRRREGLPPCPSSFVDQGGVFSLSSEPFVACDRRGVVGVPMARAKSAASLAIGFPKAPGHKQAMNGAEGKAPVFGEFRAVEGTAHSAGVPGRA